MTAKEYVAEMNRLSREECERLNNDSTRLFGAQHFDYPECFAQMYMDEGLTPAQALEALDEECQAGEAMVN